MAKGTLSSTLNETAASGADAVVTLAAVTDRKHCFRGITWAYDGDPTDGSLTVEDGEGNIVMGPHPITSGGIGELQYPWGEKGSDNTDLIFTLADGGVSKSLTVHIAP